MSGHAAFRECRNAGNRPASWNGRTGWASERGLLVTATAGGRAAGRQVSKVENARTSLARSMKISQEISQSPSGKTSARNHLEIELRTSSAVADMLAVLVNTAASGFVLSGALRAPVAQQAIQMVDVGAACTGTCKWFDSSKGFGFIAVDGEESDIFVHQSEIYSPGFRSLADGEKVEFKVSADDRTGEQQSTHMFTLSLS